MGIDDNQMLERVRAVLARQRPMALLPYQRRLLTSANRFTWSCWSRQSGKSFTLTLRRLMRGINRRRTQLFVSAGMRQCRELMLKVRQHCQVHQIMARVDQAGNEAWARCGCAQLLLPGGVRVIALPARPETIRGFTGDVLLDEFAMHRDDRAIWAAIFPTILRDEGELDIASTPKGKSNLFYQVGQNEMFDRQTVTLADAIADGLEVDMATLRKAMGDEELFRQEFLCEFLDESTAFLPYTVIAACEDEAVEKDVDWAALRESQADVYAGVDVARKRDLTVIWLWQRTTDTETRRHGEGEQRRESGRVGEGESGRNGRTEDRGLRTEPRPQQQTGREQQPQLQLPTWALRCVGVIELAGAPFAEQQEVIHRVLQLRCVRRCCIDATGMGWPLAEWAQDAFGHGRVEAVTFTAGLKAQMASQLRRLAEEGRLQIPAGEENIRNDWHSVRRSTNASGGLRLDAGHSEAGHADRFWAAAVGAYAAETGATGPLEYTGAGHLRFAKRGTW